MSIELFDFELAGTHYRFVAGNQDVVADGETFTAIPITRRDIELRGANTGSISTAVRVQMSVDQDFVKRVFGAGVLPFLTIYNWDGLSTRVLFKGKVNRPMETQGGSGGRLAVFEVLSLYDTALIGLYQNMGYQHRCNWALYDSDTCGVDESRYTIGTTITGQANGNRNLTLASVNGVPALAGANTPDNYFGGGKIRIGAGVPRKIVAQRGTTINLEVPLFQSAVNAAVTLSAGCNRTIKTCRDKFGNEPEFGGHPTIPNRSPALSDLGRPDEVC